MILVDNSERGYVDGRETFANCITVQNHDNLGIARAQNIGIQRAVESGADIIVFFDQDSQIHPGFLRSLLSPLTLGVPGVAAPVSRDAIKGFEYAAIRVSRYGFQQKLYSEGRVEPYEAHIVLSSGTAATVETFVQAGYMDEELFIDFVDLEWCLRCRRAKIPLLVVPSAVMLHSVGSRSIDLGFATLLVHSPMRSYYQIRNCFLLLRRRSVPISLAVREAIGTLVHKLLSLMVVPNRGPYIASYVHGLRDGFRGVTGKNPRGT